MRQWLLDYLTLLLQDEQTASALIEDAVARSGRDFPTNTQETFAFVRSYMTDQLSAELGPMPVLGLLDELRMRRTAPPPAGASLRATGKVAIDELHAVLVDRDRFVRAAVARALVQNGCSVSVFDSLGDVTNERFDVLVTRIVEIETLALAPLRRAECAIVIITTDVAKMREVVETLRLKRVSIASASAPYAAIAHLAIAEALR